MRTGLFFNKKSSIDYLILLAVLMTGMWQLFLCQGLMKWDMVDINLPWNYFVSECINHGRLPLWNPYSRFGFPQYGDPGTWYPLNWIIGLVRQYDLYAVHFEYLLHLLLAAIGMYKLTGFFGMSRQVKIIAAVSYMFSGFFIGNAQHIWWLINATWLPFGLMYFLRLHNDAKYADALKLGFVFFLMLSGGYPGIFIPTVYLFFVIFLILIISDISQHNLKKAGRYSLFILLAVIVFILSSSIVLVSSFDFSHYINRGTAVLFNDTGALFGTYPLKALISALFSFTATIKNTAYWGTDFSTVNTYFGFVSVNVLLFLIMSRKAPKKSIWFGCAGLIFLMIAMARIFPFRKWLYLYIPFMNVFRFSSLFRLFAIFFFILAAAYGIEKMMSDYRFRENFMKYFRIMGLLLIIFLIFFFFNIGKWKFKTIFTDGLLYFEDITGLSEKIFFQGLILLFLMGIFFLVTYLKMSWWKWAMAVLVLADMIISVQLNIHATVISDGNPSYIEYNLKKLPVAFTLPSLQKGVKEINDTTLEENMPYLWRNLGELYKLPSVSSFSPYKLTTTQLAAKKGTLDRVMDQPLIFLAKSMDKNGKIDAASVLNFDPETIVLSQFKPGDFEIHTRTDTALLLVLLQNYYPHWNALIDNQPRKILKVNDTFMALWLPEGEHQVVLNFNSKRIDISFLISLISWMICLLIITYKLFGKQNESRNGKLQTMVLILIVILFSSLALTNRKRYQTKKKIISSLADFTTDLRKDSVSIYLNVDDPTELPAKILRNATIFKLQQRKDLALLQERLMEDTSEYLLFVQINSLFMPEIDWLTKQYFPAEIMNNEFGADYYTLRRKGSVNTDSQYFSSINNFESAVSGWSGNPGCFDSLVSCSGKFSYKLDSINIYSATYEAKFSELPLSGKKFFRISLEAMIGQNTDPLIVFDVTRKGKSFVWKATHINEMIVKNHTWSKICMIKYPYEKYKSGDVLKIYVWNNSKGDVWIDDFKVELVDNDK